MSKRILFLVPYPLGEAPSQRFRFEQYFTALQQNGYTYTVQSFIDDATWKILYKPGNTIKKAFGIASGFIRRFFILFKLSQYDLVFIHREASPIGPPIFEWAIANIFGKRYIFDFDDAVWLPNTSETNAIASKLKWHDKTDSICKWAYRCSCGNDFLAQYAKQFNSNVVVNPTTIDTTHHHNKQKQQSELPVAIGWTGTLTTMKYLDEIVPVLQKLEKEYDFTFVVISNKEPDLPIKNLRFVRWTKDSEVDDLLSFHIGIMPLTDDDWSRGKCGFKALQYMSLGIPAVVSPVGVNTKIVDNNINGFVCNTPAEWENALRKLLDDTDARISFGKQAQAKIESSYSVKSNTGNFLGLFD